MKKAIGFAILLVCGLFVLGGVDARGQTAAPAAPPASATDLQTAQGRFEIPATDEGLPGEGPIRRADWFRSVWRQRRSEFAKRAEQEQHALVFLGDSITQGWGDDFRGAFDGVKIANRGISGDTTRGMLMRLEEDVLSLDPSGAVMLMGTNDLEEKTPPETIAANVRRIVEKLKEHDPKMPVILCAVMPSSTKKTRPADKIREINRLCAEAVADEPQVTVLDTWTLFAGTDGDAKIGEFPDLLHPNAAGYAKWALALEPLLATLGFTDTAPDDFTLEAGFESLFNGRDLTGWGFPPTSAEDLAAIEDWRKKDPHMPPWPIIKEAVAFDGQTSTPDGRYVAKNGRLIVTTPREGRRIQQLWTTREFPHDFVLKLEFRATPNTDSGVYIRKPQLQCRDYILAGPYKDLKNYKPQEWNELEVTVSGDKAHCICNGEVIEDHLAVPATGPVGLEGDRGQMEYRRIRIRETP